MELKRKPLHATDRARRRFGIDAGPEVLGRWIGLVEAGKARFVCPGYGEGVGHHEIDHEGVTIRVVYDRRLRRILTVLPALRRTKPPKRRRWEDD